MLPCDVRRGISLRRLTRSPLPPLPSPAYFNARLLTDSRSCLVPRNAAKDQTDYPLVFRPDRAARIDNFFA